MEASPWEKLAEDIANNDIVVTLRPGLTTTISTSSNTYPNISMDCLQVAYAEGPWGDLIGAFHVSPGVGPNNGQHSQLYVATSSTSNVEKWTVVNDGNPYSQAGSMGFIFIDPGTSAAFLAYELETSEGNTVAIRRYSNIGNMVSKAGTFDEFQLKREIHVAAEPNTWGTRPTGVKNVGTPNIDGVSGGDLVLRCHFSQDGEHDLPAKGLCSLGSSGGIQENWDHWAGFFANWVNNALRILGAAGKIGGRDSIIWAGDRTYIFEAQLKQDDWSTWRPFLLVPGQQKAFRINLNIDNTHTFANPHMVLLPGNQLLQTYFVPSQRDGNLQPGTLLRLSQLPTN